VLEVEGQRLFVIAFSPGSPAERQGLRVQDEILAVRGKTLEEWSREGAAPARVAWRELRGRAGEIVPVTVKRGNREINFQLRLAIVRRKTERPSEPQAVCRWIMTR
jgi:C-terminal processing protease CtpA/Prc